MKTFRVAALAAALLVAVGTTAQAQTTTPAPQPNAGAKQGGQPGHAGHGQGEGRGRRGRGEMMMGRALFRGIELSDAQKTQMRAIHTKYGEQRRAIWTPQRDSAARRQRPDSATRAKMVALRERETAEVRGLLTPAQQSTFDQNRAQMRQRAEARMKEGRGHRGPGTR